MHKNIQRCLLLQPDCSVSAISPNVAWKSHSICKSLKREHLLEKRAANSDCECSNLFSLSHEFVLLHRSKKCVQKRFHLFSYHSELKRNAKYRLFFSFNPDEATSVNNQRLLDEGQRSRLERILPSNSSSDRFIFHKLKP